MTDTTAAPESGVHVLQRQRRREALRWRWLALFVGLSLCSLTLDVATGPSLLALGDVLRTLVAPAAADPTTRAIVMDMRLPIALMALVVGAALGLGGVQMQTLLDNPLASPYTLGLAAAAGFGAALALVTGGLGLPSLVAIPLSAFVFCMLAASFLFGLALMRHVNSQTLILAGIALLFLFQSLLSLLQFLSSPELNQQIIFWLFGSLMRTTWPMLAITAGVTLACALLLHRDAWQLTCLRLGEARARSLGVNVTRLRLRTLVLVALMTATAVSFVGIIGFIGLVSPHIARMQVGEDQRFLIPQSALCGALMLSVASVLSKSIVPGALFPIGIVTALIGVPFMIWLILGNRKRRHA
ncbi:iron complex transport system permease protein [Hydrogenophaga palleronii]|uniref:Iron complex transport system permease protein n=1 Tax=Hydrogenophaga palleronii TaxID=65655 RepID=A0ABU1WT78_9BURK|nr:iron ABC transporter permease [Hydrogenophaga palleronii]MDR7152495.1 iron complex transport system permease protein [Hydrogenophaga palleronii]